MAKSKNRYSELIEYVFKRNFNTTKVDLNFSREELTEAAKELHITLPKNLGDIVYSFRYRAALPESIRSSAPEGKSWVIRPAGHGKYRFSLTSMPRFLPNKDLIETKVPDSTPGIIGKYATSDEQGLLAKIRYNRLIDVFTGVTCYSLQNHLRTTVQNMGQVETDEIYVGVDRRGAQFVFPVQAKGGSDQIGIVQIEQDFALCAERFPHLLCRPIAAQFIENNLIALFSFEVNNGDVAISDERHYRLVLPDEVTDYDLRVYADRPRSLT
jgi:hypothetical protein